MLWIALALAGLTLTVYTAYTMGAAEARQVAWLDGYSAGRAAEIQRKTAQYQIVEVTERDMTARPFPARKPISTN